MLGMVLVWLLVLCATIALVTWLIFTWNYLYWKRRNIPFVRPNFPFGNTGRIILLHTNLASIVCDIYERYPEYSYVGFFNLWKPAIVIRDIKIIKEVLVKQFHKFQNNWIVVEKYIDPVVAYNPAVLQGEEWKSIRSQLTPQFTSSKIKSLFPLLNKNCANLIEYIRCKTNGESKFLEVKDLSFRFTSNNVLSCAYGLDGNGFLQDVPDSYHIFNEDASENKIKLLKRTASLFFPIIRRYLKVSFIGDPVPKLFKNMILSVMQYREENNVVRNDYLGYLLELKAQNIKEDILLAHAFTFFLNGADTSATAFVYALFELSQDINLQEELVRKIQSSMESRHILTEKALKELRCIDDVIQETLRKHPIGQVIGRVCTETVELPHPCKDVKKTIVLEKGTQVFIPVSALHNDPDIYPFPEKFDPGRFSETKLIQKCAFLGFGDGPRTCLGRSFALEQIKIGLINILLEYKIKLSKKTELPIVLLNRHVFRAPKNDIWIEFHERTS